MQTCSNELTSDFYVSESTLMSYAWPEGYPILYVDAQGTTLCPECASKEVKNDIPEYHPVAWFIHEEGPTIECDDCGTPVESAYGDPDVEPEFEAEPEFDPEGGDISTEDHRKFYQHGKKVLDLTEDESDDYKEHLKTFMEKEGFFPNCWFISDHGNTHLIEF